MTAHCRPDISIENYLGFLVEYKLCVVSSTNLRMYTAKACDAPSPIGTGDTREEAREDLFNKIEKRNREDEELERDHLTARWDRAQSYRKNGEWA